MGSKLDAQKVAKMEDLGILNKEYQTWIDFFYREKKFHEIKNGDTMLPKKQRELYIKKVLTEDELEKLNNIGWEPNQNLLRRKKMKNVIRHTLKKKENWETMFRIVRKAMLANEKMEKTLTTSDILFLSEGIQKELQS